MDGSEVCSICLESIQDYRSICYLRCHHFFHTKCLLTWVLDQFTCPICRADIQGCQHCVGATDQVTYIRAHAQSVPELLEYSLQSNQRLRSEVANLTQETAIMAEYLHLFSGGGIRITRIG